MVTLRGTFILYGIYLLGVTDERQPDPSWRPDTPS